MKRIFAGVKIEPNEEFLNMVDEIKLELRHENIRWVKQNNYHLTLKFFGDTEEKRIVEIENLFDKISTNYHCFKIKVANAGVFVRDRMPKILWFDTFENEALYKLVEGIEENLISLGFNREKRPFKAHLTIGGIRYLKDKQYFYKVIEKYRNEIIQEVEINRYILFESVLKPGGPIYTELKSWKLNA
jgi:RNA 2',3'-cyclic 3'-phosphodiesterase